MATRHGRTLDDVLYPALEASKTGMLPVSELHTVYWEESGNSAGIPVMVLHGGPGGGSQPDYRSVNWFESEQVLRPPMLNVKLRLRFDLLHLTIISLLPDPYLPITTPSSGTILTFSKL